MEFLAGVLEFFQTQFGGASALRRVSSAVFCGVSCLGRSARRQAQKPFRAYRPQTFIGGGHNGFAAGNL